MSHPCLMSFSQDPELVSEIRTSVNTQVLLRLNYTATNKK